jgi:hypothetical protein
MKPQFDLIPDAIGGEVTSKKKRNTHHYKEMYESAMRELSAQRKVNALSLFVAVIGWLSFIVTIVTLFILV